MKYSIQTNDTYGRLVESNQLISRGEIVAVCEILVLSKLDTITVNSTALQYYTFVFNSYQDCLVLGDGEIFNHDDKPNVSYTLEPFDGRQRMVFRALIDIPANSQLFINYAADSQIDTAGYINNKSLI